MHLKIVGERGMTIGVDIENTGRLNVFDDFKENLVFIFK